MSVLIDSSDFEALAWDYFQHAAADGVVHAEVFFDPQAHLSRGVSYETVLAGFSAARAKALKQLRISSEIICCFLRHLPARDCELTFELEEVQASFKRGEVIGIGLDSSEKDFPPELFTTIYKNVSTTTLAFRLPVSVVRQPRLFCIPTPYVSPWITAMIDRVLTHRRQNLWD